MEIKGEILNQIAIISDLLEKINLNCTNKSIRFELNKKEFDEIFTLISRKTRTNLIDKVNNEFKLRIDDVDIIFSMNSV